MKKISFFLSAIILVLSANSQKGSFGLKAGANIYKISGLEDFQGSTARLGLHGGAFYRLPIGSMVYVQPELLYSSEGAKFEEDDFTGKINLNYINVPLMLQLATPGGFFLETGPQAGFLLSAKTKSSDGGQDTEEDIKKNTRSVSFSWGAGAGYWFGNVGLGGRYNFGLSGIPQNSADGSNKSNGFQISLLWRLKK